MANIKSVEKRARQAVTRTERNKSVRSACKTRVKNTRTAIAAGDKEDATGKFNQMASELDRAVKKGVIHKNAARRRKSALQKELNSLSA